MARSRPAGGTNSLRSSARSFHHSYLRHDAQSPWLWGRAVFDFRWELLTLTLCPRCLHGAYFSPQSHREHREDNLWRACRSPAIATWTAGGVSRICPQSPRPQGGPGASIPCYIFSIGEIDSRRCDFGVRRLDAAFFFFFELPQKRKKAASSRRTPKKDRQRLPSSPSIFSREATD